MNTPNNKLSALAIVYNEEHNIREYLDNMSFADEIIVVDSYSNDGTVEIIKSEYPHVRLYQRAFDDFSNQRNYTLDLATYDWVAFFDADERIIQKGIEEIVRTLKEDPPVAAFWVKRIFYYEGRPMINSNFNDDKTARIFRRSKCRYSDKLVHEKLDIDGESRVLEHPILHYSFKNKEDFLAKRLQYSKLRAKELHQEGITTNILHFTVKPAFRFFKYYVLKLGFVNGRRGYDIAKILGYHVYMRYVYLREMNAAAKQKILVVQQKMIGDVLASTVICTTLKETYPNAQVDYLIYDFTTPVIENNPNIDNVIIFKSELKKSRIAYFNFFFKIRKMRYDAVIDAYGKWEGGLISFISGADVRIGYKKWYTSFFYSKTVLTDKSVDGSALVHRMQLVDAFTGKKNPVEYPEIYLTRTEIDNAKALISQRLDASLPIIMISVLGSVKIKSLPLNEMANVVDVIAASANVQLLFNYLPGQADEAKAIYDLCLPETQRKIVFDLYIKNLRDFMAVLSQCRAIIGNEGGAVNMAKALDVPTFTIFSPWIKKSSWNMLEDDQTHVALHLQDYFPEIYGNRHPKEFKDDSLNLYQKLKLPLFKSKLEAFVQRVTQS